MTAFVDLVVQTVADHRVLAYALAYFMAVAEALPVVGTVVPGSVVIVALGALVPSGALEVSQLLVWSALGAITGDGTSYWLGWRYHARISRIWPLRCHPDLIAKGEGLFRAHGGKAVFASRFVQGPRAFVPLAAGMIGMPAPRFFAVNVLSALVWAPAHVLAGALLGGSIVLAGAVAGRLGVLLGLGVALVWLAVWVVRRALRLVPRLWDAIQGRALAWAMTGNTSVHREVAALLDPDRPETRAIVVFAAALVGAAWLFLAVLEDVVTGDPLVRADAAVYHLLQGLRTAWADRLLIVVTELGDGPVIAALAVAVLLWLVVRRAWRAAAYWVGGLVLASAFGTLLKLVLHVPRPAAIYAGWSAYAFPSGHATMSVVLWGLLAVFVARDVTPKWWPWIFAASATITALIAFSRLYLGAHWLSDVIGGLAFGTGWVALLSIAYLRHRPRRIGAKALVAVACGVFVVAGFVHVQGRFPEDVRRYAVRTSPIVVSAAKWRSSRWRDLPARRADLKGEYEEPLTIQWAGDLGRLKDELSRGGWRAPVPWSARHVLSWLGPRVAADRLPVLPKLHDGRLPALTLIGVGQRPLPGASRLVVRIWDSGVRVAIAGETRRTLWIGAAVAEKILRPFRLFAIARTTSDFDGPRNAVARSLARGEFVMRRRGPEAGWDGRLLLGGWRTARRRTNTE